MNYIYNIDNGYNSDSTNTSDSGTTDSTNTSDSANTFDSNTFDSNTSDSANTSDYAIISNSTNIQRNWNNCKSWKYWNEQKKTNKLNEKNTNKFINIIKSEFTNNICDFDYNMINLTKDTPFINFLINKRINCHQRSGSSHIAAFIPNLLGDITMLNQKGYGNIAIGENSDKPLHGNEKLKTHAEMDALQKAIALIRCKKIKKNKMNLIVIRINKGGNLCESAPCFHCTKELSINDSIVIDKLYFSRSDGSITCIKFIDWVNFGTTNVSTGWRWIQRMNKCKCNNL